MKQADVAYPSRVSRLLRMLAVAAALVLLPPLLVLLLLPILLFAAPAALIAIPFMLPALLPGSLAAVSEERRRSLHEQLRERARRAASLIDPMQLEPGKDRLRG